MKLTDDPHYLSLSKDNGEKSQRALAKMKLNQKTWSRDQIKSFYIIAQRIFEELGSGAAHWYISHVIAKFLKLASNRDNNLGNWGVPSGEKLYIAKVLKQVKVENKTTDDILPVTDKVAKLIEVLLTEKGSFSGIIFVKVCTIDMLTSTKRDNWGYFYLPKQERATASVLAHLLRFHPQTRDRFKIGTVVGTSALTRRSQNIGDILDMNLRQDALALFKSGKINLVIATSVLEEGIDIPACNLVLCFEKPANLKSFVQRRGRARHRDSKLVLLVDSEKDKLNEWAQLEADMRAIYEDEMRELQELLVQEDSEEGDGRVFQVTRTKALLDLENSVPYLYHFCSTLPVTEYVDTRPEFICTKEGGLIRAKVILPPSVNEVVRVAESRKAWQSEKNAIRDASFEAYVALYNAGLVNGNLLPLLEHDEIVDDLMTSYVESRAALMTVDEQINPWVEIARAWEDPENYKNIHRCTIKLGNLAAQIFLPVPFPNIQPIKIYWDSNTELTIIPSEENNSTDVENFAKAAEDTWAILQSAFGERFPVEKKQTCMLFLISSNVIVRDLLGRKPITNQRQLSQNGGLIRGNYQSNIAYVFKELLATKPSIQDVQKPYDGYEATSDNIPHLSVKRLPRGLDFLHQNFHGEQPESTKPYSVVLPTSSCTVDDMPFQFVQLGILIPSIMRRYEIYLIAQELSTTLLKKINISDLSLIKTAICASSAQEETNYQRLEFLGDSILKTCTSIQLIAEFPLWHEGILSAKKDRLVANSRLSRATIELGLDKYIITKAFTGHKWRPLYTSTLCLIQNTGKREMSSKILADVVEALIGAATLDGGLPKALVCLQTFLPELSWQPLQTRRDFLYLRAPDTPLPEILFPVESLINYKFTKPSLLTEALTHASFNTGAGSLERFEFLGDSILDYIIVTEMYPYNLSHIQMHLLRTALVNADFLAWVCMEWWVGQEETSLITPLDQGIPITQTTEMIKLPLHRFMRHTSPPLAAVQVDTAKRHSSLRNEIAAAIETGIHYPWALLAKLQAHKFYSDIIESLLAAVWIDSGSFETCKEMVERMGILPYMRRILKDGVHVWHPKEELGVWADTERVKYVLEREMIVGDGSEDEEEEETKEAGYVCTVFVGEREVVRVDGGVSKEEVKTKAAQRAIAILKTEKEVRVDKGYMKMDLDFDEHEEVKGADDVVMEL
jgi:dsRNA-specific ribonuclease